MVESDGYLGFNVIFSVMTTAMFAFIVWRARARYHRYHDDRAAISLAIAVSLLVASIGAAASALGALSNDQAIGIAGRAMFRTALFMAGLVYIGHEWDERKDPRS